MRYPFRSTALLAFGVLLLVILLWAGMRQDAPAPAGSEQVAETSTAPTTELPAEEAEAGEVMEVTSRAKSETGTTAAETANAAETPPMKEELPELPSAEQLVVLRDVESSFAAAFDGDQNEAVQLGGFLNQCQLSFQDRNRVEQSIARAERSFAEGKPLTQFRPSGPAQQFDSLEAFQSDQWNTFFRCQAARKLVNDDFWADLEQQADAGSPVARYLFATLMREPPARALTFDRWDEELELREQAREYTWRNLEDREPLGLLALVQLEGLGFSMRGIGTGASTNKVLILAAVKCGLTTPELLQSVDQLLLQVERIEKTQPGALERLNTASDEARRMFCK